MICIIPRFVAQHLRILSPVPASMPSMPTVEAAAVEAAAMEEGMGSRKSSMARPVGGAGMPCRRRMQVAARAGRPMPAGTRAIGHTCLHPSCSATMSKVKTRPRLDPSDVGFTWSRGICRYRFS